MNRIAQTRYIIFLSIIHRYNPATACCIWDTVIGALNARTRCFYNAPTAMSIRVVAREVAFTHNQGIEGLPIGVESGTNSDIVDAVNAAGPPIAAAMLAPSIPCTFCCAASARRNHAMEVSANVLVSTEHA